MMDIIVNIEKYVPLLRETLGMETTERSIISCRI